MLILYINSLVKIIFYSLFWFGECQRVSHFPQNFGNNLHFIYEIFIVMLNLDLKIYMFIYMLYIVHIYNILDAELLFCCLKNVSKSYWITVNVTVIYFLYILQDRFVSISHILWALQNMCKRIDMREKVLANFIF